MGEEYLMQLRVKVFMERDENNYYLLQYKNTYYLLNLRIIVTNVNICKEGPPFPENTEGWNSPSLFFCYEVFAYSLA